jgi:(1->4)-alpha-D-glucan 1-alpha-D-glucosylmutase
MSAPRPAALPDAEALAARIPCATYRLQFNRTFTFDDARRIVPYLDALGISDLYASSYLAARPGSLHGYDIADHTRLNPEVGTPAEFDRFVAALVERGMGQILDVIPNHMGIAAACNRWWNDVLENGPGSPFAAFFDIDWDPVKRQLANRVLLPILGDQYGLVLERQELRLQYRDGGFSLHYYETALPIAPESVAQILRLRLPALLEERGEADPSLQEYQSVIASLDNLPGRTETAADRVQARRREAEVIRRRLGRLADTCQGIRDSLEETIRLINGRRGDPRSFDHLDRLLDSQVYRLAHWRVAADEINYRRFFDINELAAIRMERDAVFREAHRLVLALVAAGKVTGLRLDHPDGLYHPAQYFRALQRDRYFQCVQARLAGGQEASPGNEAGLAEAARWFEDTCLANPRSSPCRPLYLIAEKILARGERLPGEWAVHGTTGYDLLNLINGLFVDKASEKLLTAAYGDFTGQRTPFSDLVYESKRLILQVSMSSELNVLGHALDRLAERNRHSRDFTLNSLTEALREVIANFPVYRTYIDGREAEVALQDRACIEVATAFAKRRNPATNASVFDFIRDTLLLRYPEGTDDLFREDQRAFVRKFQQLTAPVTAKGIEDTAFYRYNRLISLNEVGGEPERFGVGLDEFHARCVARQSEWPASLSATSTHDTKRGEDVRARINVLSEFPRQWRAAVSRWHRINRRHLTSLDGESAPDRNDEYLLYQTLIGAWPLAPMGPEENAAFALRIQEFLLKAGREAKIRTSWINPDEPYESAVRSFVARILDPATGRRFLREFAVFQRPIAQLGMVNGLAQVLLKITTPGVPDFFQGTELWDLSLVDPDNRRPVDFAPRIRLLEELQTRIATGDLMGLARELIVRWPDGRVKLYAIHRALAARRAALDLFRNGAYLPLPAEGPCAESLCAFVRQLPGWSAITVVPRLNARNTEGGSVLPLGPAVWRDTIIRLPGTAVDRYLETFTGERVTAHPHPEGRQISVADLLAVFPVALLVSHPAEASTDGQERTP